MIVSIKIAASSVFRLPTPDHLSKEFTVTGIIGDNQINLCFLIISFLNHRLIP